MGTEAGESGHKTAVDAEEGMEEAVQSEGKKRTLPGKGPSGKGGETLEDRSEMGNWR